MWLLDKELEHTFTAAVTLTAEQITLAESMALEADGASALSVKKGVASISIDGILTEQRDFMAWLFGGGNTLYPDIRGAVAQADADPNIKLIELSVGSSRGGNSIGLWPTMEAIRKTKTPTRMRVQHIAASATYMIGAVCDEISAADKGTLTGSVGVAMDIPVNAGVVSISNPESPLKRLDVTTPEGVEAVQGQLSSIYKLYGGAAAKGRGKSLADVNKTFGQGSMLLASEALAVGMIDKIESGPRVSKKPTAAGGKKQEVKSMDLITLKREHPGVYAEAVADGASQERNRVSAHLTMGNSHSAMDLAIQAIEDGSELSQLHIAKYMSAEKNAADVAARGEDNPDTGGTPPKLPAPVVADDGISEELANSILADYSDDVEV